MMKGRGEMARDYQPKKSKYILPRAVYHSTLWIIRDYSRMVECVNDVILSSPAPDGMPKGSNISDPTAMKAMSLPAVTGRIRAIEEAKRDIPEEYMKGIWNNIQYGSPFPDDAHRVTYSKYKSKYVFSVAKSLNMV